MDPRRDRGGQRLEARRVVLPPGGRGAAEPAAVAASARHPEPPSRARAHRLLYLCDWLPPDFGAVGQYSLLFAREHMAAGMDVVLVGLSSQADSLTVERHHPETGAHQVGRLRILRLRTPMLDRARLRHRAWWTLRTNLCLLWAARRFAAWADEVRFTGSPPFLVHLLVPLNAVWWRKRLTYRITDFHPECLMAALPRVPWSLRAFYHLTLSWRRRVHCFEALGEDQRARLAMIGIGRDRVVLKRDPSPVRIPPRTQPLAIPEALSGKTILLYSGNLGVAHDHATFVAGYIRHHHEGSGRVGLWLNAIGAQVDEVEVQLRDAAAPLARTALVPLGELPRLLVTPHAHLITLRREFVGFVLPSKVYGCIASGRDILYVGPRSSDVHLLCAQDVSPERYHQVDPGSPADVFEALESLGARTPR